jgi:CRISPR/Cas system endoribonuclease Cas6 (RAMP superfamily)
MQIRLPRSAHGTKRIGRESNSVIKSETGATQESLLKNLQRGTPTQFKEKQRQNNTPFSINVVYNALNEFRKAWSFELTT